MVDTLPEGARAEGATIEEPATVEPAAMEPQAPHKPTSTEADRSWGVGPSGAASPPPEQMPTSSPPRTESEHVKNAEGSRAGLTPRGFSLINDGRRAEQLMSYVVQPNIQEELQNLGANRFFREVFSALVQVTNSFVLAREAIDEGEAVTRQVQQDAEEAQARAEAAEKALELVRAECADKIKEAESRAEAEADQRRAALNQLTEAEGAIEARNLHIADLNSAIQKAEDWTKRAK